MAVSDEVLHLRNKVQAILTDKLEVVRVDNDGDFIIPFEKVTVLVRCLPFGSDGETYLQMYAPVLADVPATPELFEYVALHSDDFIFGHLSATKDGEKNTASLWFSHSLLGDYLDSEELHSALRGIIVSGGRLTDELHGVFGGRKPREESNE